MAVEHLSRAVAVQDGDENSTLNFYRNMLAFRQAHAPLRKGDLTILTAEDTSLSFIRSHEGYDVFCAFNLSASAQPLQFPEGDWAVDRGAPFTTVTTGRGLQLPPFQACFAVRQDSTN